jgi:hypothetical protein
VSVDQVILDGLEPGIEREPQDDEFMSRQHSLVERDEEILDRLPERDTPSFADACLIAEAVTAPTREQCLG